MAKRTSDIDVLLYRVDALERRLESVERALINRTGDGGSGGINTELLNIVLSMVRQQTGVVVERAKEEVTSSKSPRVAAAPVAESSSHENAGCVDSTHTIGKSFMFNRRKTVV